MNIECKHTINIETTASGFVTRPITIELRQSFDIEIVRNSLAREVEWKEDGCAIVSVMAGDFELFNDDAANLGGWMGRLVTNAIADGIKWDITEADAMEMLANEADNEAHEREHAAGRL